MQRTIPAWWEVASAKNHGMLRLIRQRAVELVCWPTIPFRRRKTPQGFWDNFGIRSAAEQYRGLRRLEGEIPKWGKVDMHCWNGVIGIA